MTIPLDGFITGSPSLGREKEIWSVEAQLTIDKRGIGLEPKFSDPVGTPIGRHVYVYDDPKTCWSNFS